MTPVADLLELRGIAAVAGEVDAEVIDADHVAAPERAVAIPGRPRREVLRRNARDLDVTNSHGAPPVELMDRAATHHLLRHAERRNVRRLLGEQPQ